MKKNNDEKKLSLLFIGTFFIFAFFIIFSHKAKAEGVYFPMGQNDNDVIDPWIIEYAETTYLSEENDIIIKGPNYISGYEQYFIAICPRDQGTHLYGELNNNGYQFDLYQIGNANITYREVKIQKPQYWYWDNDDYSHYYSWHNCDSSLYNTSIGYVSNFILYNTNNEDHVIVLKYGPDPIPPIDIGVAIIPPGAIVPEYPTGTTPPTQVPPIYTPNNYEWTTPPTFDGSTVTNAIGSIQNTLGWLANNLKEEFKNITDNGKHFFEYIGKTIQYYGNAIIETLNNLMKNFYDNMKSLVEPIYTKIEGLYNDFLEFADLFINPFDEEEFEDQIDNCQLITQYNELLDNCEVLQQIFDETSEPDSFILYIDFENPFADSEHKIIHGEINFNWLVPLRPVYRPFLQVFVLIECFVGGFRILGNIIGGKAK